MLDWIKHEFRFTKLKKDAGLLWILPMLPAVIAVEISFVALLTGTPVTASTTVFVGSLVFIVVSCRYSSAARIALIASLLFACGRGLITLTIGPEKNAQFALILLASNATLLFLLGWWFLKIEGRREDRAGGDTSVKINPELVTYTDKS